MDDFFKKLNVLVKTTISDVLGEAPAEIRRRLTNVRFGDDLDREVAILRGRINDALDFEDGLQKRVQAAQAEVERWNQEADQAVAAEDDVAARYAINQVQVAQQRLALAESDLRDHQRVTQELIMRVNTLESAVADAKRAEADKQAQVEQESAPAPSETTSTAAPSGQTVLSDVLRDIREKVTQMGETLSAKSEINQPPNPEPEAPDDDQIEDDLAARRQRLSKPKQP